MQGLANIEEKLNEDTKSKVKALKIMGSRRLSSSEIKKRLIQKGEDEATAESTTVWLEKMGIVDDEEYARLIVSHYIARGYGLARIKDELYKRGIQKELWDDSLAGIDDNEVLDAADVFLQKKLRDDFDQSDIKRASDALLRRGFTFEQAKSAINKYLQVE